MNSSGSKESLQMYHLALVRLNKCFQVYNRPVSDGSQEKILHFTSKQMRNFPNLLNFYQNGPEFSSNSRNVAPDQFEEFFNNVQLLKDLKITCEGEFIAELQYFRSLEQVHIVGPCLNAVKGLRAVSCNLKSLTAEKGMITLNDLISTCCMDESGRMSWPQLLCLKVSLCGIHALDDSLKLLPNLQELDLSFNKITTIGNVLCCLTELTHLNLSFNHLQDIPQLRESTGWRLQFLNLAYNEISTLDGLTILERLKVLDLSNNLLLQHDALEPLRYLNQLENLDLRGNPICSNKKHRLKSLQSISPQAVKPDFQLDGRKLSKKDLKDGNYTPVAVAINPYAVNRDFASINAVEPELYDVSMSSTPGFRRTTTDAFAQFKSQSYKQKRISTKLVTKISTSNPNLTDHTDVSDDDTNKLVGESSPLASPPEGTAMLGQSRDSYNSLSSVGTPMDFEKDSEDESSIVSAISQDSVSDREISHVSISGSPVSCRDEDESKQTSASDGYFSPIDDYNVYDDKNSKPSAGKIEPVTDGRERNHSSATSDSKTSDTDTLTGGLLDENELDDDVTPPLHVKRSIGVEFDEDIVLSGPSEVYLAATHNHLIERDMMSGKIWEQLELSTVSDVALLAKPNLPPVIDVKFTYLRKNRRARRYTVLDIGANEAISLLIRELESVAMKNRSLGRRRFVCLKCSRPFTVDPGQNSYINGDVAMTTVQLQALKKLSNTQTNHSGIVCACGSDWVVETEGVSKLFTVNEDECQEATESTTDIRQFRSFYKGDRSASVDVGRTVAGADASLSWMHTLQSVPDVSGPFSQVQRMQPGEDDSHLSGSLPTDLSSVLMRPNERLGNAISVPAVDGTQQAPTPFKTFSHHLTPHDLYKLVNVTHSINTKNVTKIDQHPHEISEGGRFTPQQSNNQSGTSVPKSGHRQMMVTSTPRRRPAGAQVGIHALSVGSNHLMPDVGASIISRDVKRRRALNFDGDNEQNTESYEEKASLAPVEYYEWDENNEMEATNHRELGISQKLKLFIEDELLEAEEEICAVVQTRIVRESGKALNALVLNSRNAGTPSSKRKGLFGSAKKPTQNSPNVSTLSPVVSLQEEIDVLLLLTTDNVQILRVTESTQTIGPETLDCMSSYNLDRVIGLELGLSNCTLYFAVTEAIMKQPDLRSDNTPSPSTRTSSGKKKKFNIENIEQVYAVHFRNSEKCEMFYRRWLDLINMRLEPDSRAASTSSCGSTPAVSRSNSRVGVVERRTNSLTDRVEDDRCASAFSDALEKNFSEYVLMSLNLSFPEPNAKKDPNSPKVDVSSDKLLTERLFAYIPCWLLDESIGKEVPIGLVVSCGGSLSLMVEESLVIMYEFATALVRAQTRVENSRVSSASLVNSYSSSTSSRSQSCVTPMHIPQSAISSLARAAYTKKISTRCSEIKSMVRFKDHPMCLELNFMEDEKSEKNVFHQSWQLTFAWPSILEDTQELIKAYYEVEKNEELEVMCK